jgi:hypothetical protein
MWIKGDLLRSELDASLCMFVRDQYICLSLRIVCYRIDECDNVVGGMMMSWLDFVRFSKVRLPP